MRKAIVLGLILLVFCGMLTGCYDRREVDDMAYVVAIGLDKGKTNNLKMTFQIAKPVKIGGGGEGGGGGGEEAYTITVIETPTLYAGFNMVNTFLSRQINLSHAKVIIISKELAEAGGLEKYIHACIRGKEFRPNLYVVVSRSGAEEYIRSVKPQLENNPAKYYELSYRAASYTGLIARTQLYNFYSQLKSYDKQAVAILAGVGRFKSAEEMEIVNSTFREKGREIPHEGDFKAGDVPEVSDSKGEVMGLAMFDGDKMVGELDGEETSAYFMVTGEYKYAYWTIEDPQAQDHHVLLNISQSRKPQHHVEMVSGQPVIDTKVILEADILSIQSGINYEKPENLNVLEQEAESHITRNIISFLNHTRELNVDTCGFGSELRPSFLTWKEWQDLNWKSKYKDATFNVDVDLKIRRPGLIIRTSPTISSKGEERE